MAVFGACCSCLLCKLIQAFSAQGGGRYNLAAEDGAEPFGVNADAALLQQVCHVQGDDNRDASLDQLGGQIQIPFNVGCIDQVDDDVRILTQDIVPADDFFKCVGRKRVDAGKIGDDRIAAAEFPLHLSFFFLNSDARPVSDILAASCQGVEHRCLPAVRVAGKCKFQCHRFLHLFRSVRFGRLDILMSVTADFPCQVRQSYPCSDMTDCLKRLTVRTCPENWN